MEIDYKKIFSSMKRAFVFSAVASLLWAILIGIVPGTLSDMVIVSILIGCTAAGLSLIYDWVIATA